MAWFDIYRFSRNDVLGAERFGSRILLEGQLSDRERKQYSRCVFYLRARLRHGAFLFRAYDFDLWLIWKYAERDVLQNDD